MTSDSAQSQSTPEDNFANIVRAGIKAIGNEAGTAPTLQSVAARNRPTVVVPIWRRRPVLVAAAVVATASVTAVTLMATIHPKRRGEQVVVTDAPGPDTKVVRPDNPEPDIPTFLGVTTNGVVQQVDFNDGRVIRTIGQRALASDPKPSEGSPNVVDRVWGSPDGKYVYVSECCEPAGGWINRIEVGETLTQAVQPSIEGTFGEWLSATANGVVATSGIGGITIDSFGPKPTRVTATEYTGDLAWSPNGRRLAYLDGADAKQSTVSWRDVNEDLDVSDAAPSIKLAVHAYEVEILADNSMLLITSIGKDDVENPPADGPRQLLSVDIDGTITQLRSLPDGAHSLAADARGERVLFVTGDDRIMIRGDDPTQFMKGPLGFVYADWSETAPNIGGTSAFCAAVIEMNKFDGNSDASAAMAALEALRISAPDAIRNDVRVVVDTLMVLNYPNDAAPSMKASPYEALNAARDRVGQYAKDHCPS